MSSWLSLFLGAVCGVLLRFIIDADASLLYHVCIFVPYVLVCIPLCVVVDTLVTFPTTIECQDCKRGSGYRHRHFYNVGR